MTDSTSRRAFVQTSGLLVSGTWLAMHLPAVEAAAAYARRALAQGLPLQTLTPEEAPELEAVAAQIFPTDETAGAREAGVIYFMDRALGSFGSAMLEPIRAGLPDLRQAAAARSPGATGFAALPFAQQTEVLKSMEQTPFFGAVRFLTVAGMFADPSYGGNRNEVGWRLLGFEGAHAYQPPFGYYDREYRAQGR